MNDRQTIKDLEQLCSDMRADRAKLFNETLEQIKSLRAALIKCKSAAEDKNLPPSARLELVRDFAAPALNGDPLPPAAAPEWVHPIFEAVRGIESFAEKFPLGHFTPDILRLARTAIAHINRQGREPVTVCALADHRLGRRASTGADFEEAQLPLMGGCEVCGATLAAFNAHPCKTGFLRCRSCLTDTVAWFDVAEANRELFGQFYTCPECKADFPTTDCNTSRDVCRDNSLTVQCPKCNVTFDAPWLPKSQTIPEAKMFTEGEGT